VVWHKWNAGFDAAGNNIRRGDGEQKYGRKCSLFGVRLGNPTVKVDGSVPKPVYGIPSEMAACNGDREAPIRVFLILERVVYDLEVERSVREIGPSR